MTVLLCSVSSFFHQIFFVFLQYGRSKNKDEKTCGWGDSHADTIKMQSECFARAVQVEEVVLHCLMRSGKASQKGGTLGCGARAGGGQLGGSGMARNLGLRDVYRGGC